MLREQTCEQQTDYLDDCLQRLTKGHQYATAAWIWQILGLMWDPERAWTTERKRASQGRAQDCLAQWSQEVHRRPGVMEYINKHNGTIIRTLVGQLREGRSRLRQRAKTKGGGNEATELEHMRRRLQEWTKGIPINYRAAADTLIADRTGIGIEKALHWQHAGTEAGYTPSRTQTNPTNGAVTQSRQTH